MATRFPNASSHHQTILLLTLLAVLSVCTSCVNPGTLLRLDDPALAPTIRASPKTLVVLQPLKHRVNSFPAGRYTAKFSDRKGVYYEAPEKIIQKDPIYGAGVVTGGFYFSASRPLFIRSYIEYQGTPIKVLGDITDLSYRFEQ